MSAQSSTGIALVVAGSLLYLPAMLPGTGWLGIVAALPATLTLIYGTLLVARAGDGPSV